ncbi:lipase family protein [Actinokineospora sp. G85]|uniref:lipase family protein n=1 Tax=Actinokineospora sp. G85 TaxID=3406626 RepID=UPI003C767E5E
MKPRVRRAAMALPLTALAVVTAVVQAPASSAAPAAPAQSVSAAAAADNEPQDPDFYVPPNPLPQGKPGDIIRSKQTKTGAYTDRITSWKVMYLSTDALGAPIAVTGTILVPKGKDPKTTPVVSFAVGTHGPAFRCTPSYQMELGVLYEAPAVLDFIKEGWSVAVTDYEGYGPNPSDTTYVTGKSEGNAVLDAVRAGQRLGEVGFAADAKVLLRGYSQGGGASLWAAQAQPTYAPELNVLAVAAGGVPADLTQVALTMDGKRGSGFLLYALYGLDNAYPDLKLDSYLNDAGRKVLSELESGACTVELLSTYANKKLLDLTTSSPVLTPPWLARVAENKLGPVKIGMPVYQYMGAQDELVAPSQQRKLRTDLCANGTSVQFKEFQSDHITLVYRGNKDALDFMKARLAGTAPTPNCGA